MKLVRKILMNPANTAHTFINDAATNSAIDSIDNVILTIGGDIPWSSGVDHVWSCMWDYLQDSLKNLK